MCYINMMTLALMASIKLCCYCTTVYKITSSLFMTGNKSTSTRKAHFVQQLTSTATNDLGQSLIIMPRRTTLLTILHCVSKNKIMLTDFQKFLLAYFHKTVSISAIKISILNLKLFYCIILKIKMLLISTAHVSTTKCCQSAVFYHSLQ